MELRQKKYASDEMLSFAGHVVSRLPLSKTDITSNVLVFATDIENNYQKIIAQKFIKRFFSEITEQKNRKIVTATYKKTRLKTILRN